MVSSLPVGEMEEARFLFESHGPPGDENVFHPGGATLVATALEHVKK